MLKFINIIILTVLVSFSTSSQVPPKKNVLAVGLFTGAHSSLITYAFLQMRGDQITGARLVREDVFMYTAMGHWPGLVNLDRENLFEKYGVDSCFLVYDEYDKVAGWYAKPFRLLWKLRFYEHPYQFDTPGWSQGRIKPSLYQMQFIKQEYGVKNVLTEYFYGDTLFKLLRDVQNPQWISLYKTADSTIFNQGP
ncbi:MAG: hypothetical protein MI810_18480 [Flavobacteriales bacterium]|nr:hypothetical protein [Flavobacteriales bacterium]